MPNYAIISQYPDGRREREICAFEDDDAAISYIVPIARGRLVEVWRSGRLVASVDERPCAAIAS